MNAHSVKLLAKESEVWSIDDLIPYARNAKKHPPEQIAQIAASMREFGFTIPVLVAEDGTIIAGHGRVLAAQKLGLTEVPVIVARGWSEEQKRAYRIADNKLAENAEWDEELLKIELGELREEGFDVDLIGFDAAALDKLLADDGEDAEDEPHQKVGNLSERFGLPSFTVLNAREGWWQERKRGWLALGIQSELGRGENTLGMSQSSDAYRYDKKNYTARHKANAEPGGSKMPAADYSKTKARGDGRGRAVA